MARSVNRCFLIGSAGRDPEIRFTPSGSIVASLSLATNERRKDKEGNWQDHTEWHSLAAFLKQAELARDFIKKGTKLYVEGRLQTRSWERDGQTHYRTEIVVQEFILLSEKASSSPPGAPQPEPRPQKTLTEELEETEITELDIPF